MKIKGIKYILAALGLVSLGLGILGAFLPLLPTTPFVLLTAYFFARSSTRLENWLLNHKIFGTIIRDFRTDKSITLHAKIISISMLWLTMSTSMVFVVDTWWLRILLLFIALGVTWHISSYKTKK